MLNHGNLFVKDVDRIDCSIFDPSTGITGQSWHVDIAIEGELDENGFVHDFSLVKSLVKETLKSSVDHALIIPIKSKYIEFKESDSEEVLDYEVSVISDWGTVRMDIQVP